MKFLASLFNKKIFRVIVCLIVILLLAEKLCPMRVFADERENTTTYQLWSTTTSLNLRAAPSKESKKILTIPIARNVEMKEYGKEWSKVVFDDMYEGYVYTSYLILREITLPAERELIAFCTTGYVSSSSNRKTNVALGSESFNGLVLKPNETNSFISVVGPTTTERGYKKAGQFVDGKLVQGVGGGICQVSSTLYSALLDTPNVEIIKQRSHSKRVTYIEWKVRDATIASPYTDLTFKNNNEFDLYVYTYNIDSWLTIVITR